MIMKDYVSAKEKMKGLGFGYRELTRYIVQRLERLGV